MKKESTYAIAIKAMKLADVLAVVSNVDVVEYINAELAVNADALAVDVFSKASVLAFAIVRDLQREVNNKSVSVVLDCEYTASNYVKRHDVDNMRFDYIDVVYNSNAKRALQLYTKANMCVDIVTSSEKSNRDKFEKHVELEYKQCMKKEKYCFSYRSKVKLDELTSVIKATLAVLAEKAE